jgi:nitrite reductase (NO-forming)
MHKSIRAVFKKKYTSFILTFLIISAACEKKDPLKTPLSDKIYHAYLSDAPYVSSMESRNGPAKVIVNLEVKEVEGELVNGTKYTFWTFGGKVPGKFIRINRYDLVEFHLSNHPNNKLPHNIDLHAVTGPGGGAEASLTAPGHTSVFSFKALNPGLFIYHCATAPVGMHIANGMYGLIMVDDPENPLPKVDNEYYIMQSEFYTKGNFGDHGLQDFSMAKALDENPDYVVFNGSVGANTGEKAMQVKVGETIRLFIGNAGPNLVSSFHVIGEIFDKVYIEGGTLAINNNVQSTLIPAGGTSIVEFKCEVPGTLNIVDHSIFRAFNKGALAQIIVSGEENKSIYSHKQKDEVYLLEGSAIENNVSEAKPEIKESPEADRMELGKNIFVQNCASCHQKNGEGVPNAFPPLAGSDFLMKREDKGVNIVLKGLSGSVTVNGKKFNGVMPALGLNEDQVASVLTYVRNSWGNQGGPVSLDDVKKLKK